MKTCLTPVPGRQSRAGLIESKERSSVAGIRRSLCLLALAALAFTNSTATTAGAKPSQPVDGFPAFIPMPGLSAEGVTVDKKGTVFVSVRDGDQAKVWRFTPTGEPSPITTIDSGIATGLGIAPDGALYAAVAEGTGRGVYRVGRKGNACRLPGTEQIIYANGLAFDQRGTVYVSESYSLNGSTYGQGGIWRIRSGKSAELWLRDDLLTGIGAVLGYPVGANGIALFQGDLYVVNTDKGLIVRVPIRRDGRPGQPAVWTTLQEVPGSPLAGSPFPVMGDGLELDEQGNAYVALVSRNAVVHIDAGTLEQATIASLSDYPAAPLDTPPSLALGPRDRCGRDLFVTNLGWMSTIIPGPQWPGAGLVKLNADARSIKGSLVGEVWWEPTDNTTCACESGYVAITAATGELSQLHATEALFTHCAPAPTDPDMKFVCTEVTFVAANGDELWATYDTEHYTGEPFAGPLFLTFTGGTGSLRGATGSAVLNWQVVPIFIDGQMDLSRPWVWSAELDGSINLPPPHRCRRPWPHPGCR